MRREEPVAADVLLRRRHLPAQDEALRRQEGLRRRLRRVSLRLRQRGQSRPALRRREVPLAQMLLLPVRQGDSRGPQER